MGTLNTRNTVPHIRRPHSFIPRQPVGQQRELFSKEFGPPVCFPGRKAVAVTVKRTGAGIPKFADILRRVAQHVTPPKHGINCRNNERMIAVARFDPAEDNKSRRYKIKLARRALSVAADGSLLRLRGLLLLAGAGPCPESRVLSSAAAQDAKNSCSLPAHRPVRCARREYRASHRATSSPETLRRPVPPRIHTAQAATTPARRA